MHNYAILGIRCYQGVTRVTGVKKYIPFRNALSKSIFPVKLHSQNSQSYSLTFGLIQCYIHPSMILLFKDKKWKSTKHFVRFLLFLNGSKQVDKERNFLLYFCHFTSSEGLHFSIRWMLLWFFNSCHPAWPPQNQQPKVERLCLDLHPGLWSPLH